MGSHAAMENLHFMPQQSGGRDAGLWQEGIEPVSTPASRESRTPLLLFFFVTATERRFPFCVILANDILTALSRGTAAERKSQRVQPAGAGYQSDSKPGPSSGLGLSAGRGCQQCPASSPVPSPSPYNGHSRGSIPNPSLCPNSHCVDAPCPSSGPSPSKGPGPGPNYHFGFSSADFIWIHLVQVSLPILVLVPGAVPVPVLAPVLVHQALLTCPAHMVHFVWFVLSAAPLTHQNCQRLI